MSFDLPTGSGGNWISYPVVDNNKDGRLEVIELKSGGDVWHRWQAHPNKEWNADGWTIRGLGGLGGSFNDALDGGPAVSHNKDGRLEVYVRNKRNILYHKWQTDPNNGWSDDWKSLGAIGGDEGNIYFGTPKVGRNKDGRQEIFVVGGDGQIYHRWQTHPNNGWNHDGWVSLGGPGGSVFELFTLIQNMDRSIQVFVLGGGNELGQNMQLYHRWQTEPNSTEWNPEGWVSLGSPTCFWPVAGTLNLHGRMEVFLAANDGQIYHRWQTEPNSTEWNPEGWVSLEAPLNRYAISVGFNGDGKLQVFIVNPN